MVMTCQTQGHDWPKEDWAFYAGSDRCFRICRRCRADRQFSTFEYIHVDRPAPEPAPQRWICGAVIQDPDGGEPITVRWGTDWDEDAP